MKKTPIYHYRKNPDDYRLSEDEKQSMNWSVSSDNPQYKPSILQQVYLQKFEDGSVKLNTDTHLMLYDKKLSEKVGLENINQYLANGTNNMHSYDTSSFTDEQLIEMTRDRRLSNQNDAYQYQRVLSSEFERVRIDADSRIAYKKRLQAEKDELKDILSSNLTT